jgi:hypothetical protein
MNKETGIIQKSIQNLFSYVKTNKEKYQFNIKASLIEIVNEEYRDLLNCNM